MLNKQINTQITKLRGCYHAIATYTGVEQVLVCITGLLSPYSRIQIEKIFLIFWEAGSLSYDSLSRDPNYMQMAAELG